MKGNEGEMGRNAYSDRQRSVRETGWLGLAGLINSCALLELMDVSAARRTPLGLLSPLSAFGMIGRQLEGWEGRRPQ